MLQTLCSTNRLWDCRGRICIGSCIVVASLIGLIPRASTFADLSISPLSHDFGDVRSVDELRFEFQIANRSNIRVRGLLLQPDCGCTSLGSIPSELRAHSQIRVEVKFNAENMRGHVVKKIVVRWQLEGSTSNYVDTIELRANVQPLYRTRPSHLEFISGRPATTSFEVSGGMSEAWELDTVTCSTATLTAGLVSNQDEAAKATVEVKYNPNCLPKIKQTIAFISVSINDRHRSRVEVPVRFNSLDELQLPDGESE